MTGKREHAGAGPGCNAGPDLVVRSGVLLLRRVIHSPASAVFAPQHKKTGGNTGSESVTDAVKRR
jgi:hypothetical protein